MIKINEGPEDIVWKEFHKTSYNGYCPICNDWTISFVDFYVEENNPIKILLCSKCQSHPRHRILYLYLKEVLDHFKDDINFLHFAPEICLTNLIESYRNIKYLSVDLYRTAMQVEDITNLTFKNGTFDFILNVHVLEHIMDEHKAFSELYRVLKPGGAALINVPIDTYNDIKTFEDKKVTDPAERSRLFGQHDHVRQHGRDIVKRFEKIGFVVYPVFLTDILSVEEKIKFGIHKEYLFLCFKPNGNRHFIPNRDSIFKSLPNIGQLHLLKENNGYIVDATIFQKSLFRKRVKIELEYRIKTKKTLFIGAFEGQLPQEFTYCHSLEILPKNKKVRFEININNEKILDKDQMKLAIQILNPTDESYDIIDEVYIKFNDSRKMLWWRKN